MFNASRANDEAAATRVPALMHGMDTSEELWAFAYNLFKTGNIESWCLSWQRLYGLDISFLLWAGWLQHMRGSALSASQMLNALDKVSEWRQRMIVPVRAARQYLDVLGPYPTAAAAHGDLRGHLRAAELESERHEQELLVEYTSSESFEAANNRMSRSNMAMYLSSLAEDLSSEDQLRIAEMDRCAEVLAHVDHE